MQKITRKNDDGIRVIYGLFDPRNGELRYIGYTSKQTLDGRYSKHITEKKVNHKNNWIKSLRELGLKPEIYVFEETDDANRVFLEQWYIEYYRGLGARLTNVLPGGETGPVPQGSHLSMKHRMNVGKVQRITTEEQDKEIKRLYWEKKMSSLEISKIMNLSPATIMRIARGRDNSWEEKRPSRIRKDFTKEEKEEILKLVYETDLTLKDIAEKFGTGQPTLSGTLKDMGFSFKKIRAGKTNSLLNSQEGV